MKKLLIGVVLLFAAIAATLYLSPATLLTTIQFAQREMAGLTAKQVQVGDSTIHYLEGGSQAAPTVLLLHGFAADKDQWLPFVLQLSSQYHVLALDLPGFGENSKNPDAAYDVGAQAERLAAFIRQLGIHQPNIVGSSMGGWIAALHAARYPDQVSSVALFDNAGITSPQPSEFQLILERGEANPLLISSPEDFDRLMPLIFVKPPQVPGPLKQLVIDKAIASHEFNQEIFAQLLEHYIPLEPVLARIKVPVLLLWGAQDKVFDVSSIEVMKPLLKQPSVVIMQDCGHAPMVERPEETATHYEAFLDSIKG
ncbi:Pimeloyl-ACP methyl ester carboxylesterase [Pseudomonas pohangensis]|uniref:Pimeloyl-ACP methyl ester carboxylesterase n=1 Tax=Pseudomonas pohangensis TaxID=364197 RepID=A0A1H2GXG7_9PSED|nr:alpha/beta fold hydrolase [Pseudomonas pohangensis]SDU24209.1 Pimeloyl-ACP methyl ester carboxylesterase [Pseudomonas pohangensis]